MRKKHEHSIGPSEEAAFEFGSLYTTFKNDLKSLAAQTGGAYSFAELATRVANLLESEALREQLGHPKLLPEMWQNGAPNRGGRRAGRGDQTFGALSEDAFGSRPHVMSKKARKAIARAQRKRWAKFHKRQAGRRATWKKGKRAQRARRVINEELTARGTPRKRKLTPAQLAAMRANAVKAHAANRKKRHHSPMSAEQRANISAAMKAAFAARKVAGAA